MVVVFSESTFQTISFPCLPVISKQFPFPCLLTAEICRNLSLRNFQTISFPCLLTAEICMKVISKQFNRKRIGESINRSN